MQNKKKWFYILVGMIVILCIIYIVLSFWIFRVIQKDNQNSTVDSPKINQMLKHIMPQLNYQDNMLKIKELNEEEILWLGLKVTYHIPTTTKSTILSGNGKQIQIQAKDVKDILKSYFHITLPIDQLSLPYGVQYNRNTDSYLLTVNDVFGNFQSDFKYHIMKQETKKDQQLITLKAVSNHETTTYKITFDCDNDCYFVSSEIIK